MTIPCDLWPSPFSVESLFCKLTYIWSRDSSFLRVFCCTYSFLSLAIYVICCHMAMMGACSHWHGTGRVAGAIYEADFFCAAQKRSLLYKSNSCVGWEPSASWLLTTANGTNTDATRQHQSNVPGLTYKDRLRPVEALST